MAAQRVQRYLDKHKIGPLFESLMAQVIQDTPDDPVGYIIKVLQGMHKKQRIATDLVDDISVDSRSLSRKSMSRSSQNEANKMKSSSNTVAASWSAGEPQSNPRDYPRPWSSSNRKSLDNKTWSPEQNSRKNRDDATSWNNDTRVPSHDFDELFQLQNGEEKPAEKVQKYRGVKSWNAQEEHTQEKETRDGEISGDELESELKLGKYKKSKSTNEDHERSVSPAAVSKSRPMKARRAVEEHRQQLQALLLEENSGKTNELRNARHSPEEGMEILENIEELEEEGVHKTTTRRRGAKLNKSNRSKDNDNVSVTICARCARIIGKKDEVDSSSEVGSVFNEKNGLSSHRITWKDDNNFDTSSETSEIMGDTTRKNVWPVASDTESDITPRNNKMFKRVQSSSEKEVKHLYRHERPSSPEPSSRPSTSRSKLKASGGFSNSPRKSWGTNGYSSDNETEVEATRPSTPGSISGQPWEIPSDNNSDDESKVSRRPAKSGFSKVKKSTRRSRGFSIDTSSSVADTDY